MKKINISLRIRNAIIGLLLISGNVCLGQPFSGTIEVPDKTDEEIFFMAGKWFYRIMIPNEKMYHHYDPITCKILAEGDLTLPISHLRAGYFLEVQTEKGRYKYKLTPGVIRSSTGGKFYDYKDIKRDENINVDMVVAEAKKMMGDVGDETALRMSLDSVRMWGKEIDRIYRVIIMDFNNHMMKEKK